MASIGILSVALPGSGIDVCNQLPENECGGVDSRLSARRTKSSIDSKGTPAPRDDAFDAGSGGVVGEDGDKG